MNLKTTTPSLRQSLPLAIAGACLSVVLFTGGAYAMGDESNSTPTCHKGQIWSSKAGKCVRQQGSLDTLKNPNTAEALNYRGYATRQLGRTDEGISYYLESVALDPHYAKVREYLGEAYVIKGQMKLARAQLATIKNLRGTRSEEYRDLSEAIADPSSMHYSRT
jgi:tetratricopeptide (TPR) repeat protein